ncbi:MAG: SMP-30/gluconolactonase/LRE family protein, partial [Bacteroidota bacterium]
RRSTKWIFLGALILLLGYVLAWPIPVDPAAWNPPPAPDLSSGRFQENTALEAATITTTLPLGHGPEDVAVDSLGRVYAGLVEGQIVRYAQARPPEVLVNTGGRPLGLAWDSLGNLLIADAHKGLLSLSPEAELTVLSTQADGLPFGFADDLDIAANGKVYFSDASHKFSVEDYKDDLLEHRPHGRLVVYDPATRQTSILMDSLFFANGIAVSPEQDFVLVVETGAYRIQRYWLTGPKAGTAEIFIENLPGFPDGVSADTSGVFWVAMANPRNPTLDAVLPYPFLRKIIKRLPEAVQPAPVRYGMVFGLNRDGEIVANLQDPIGRFAPVTSVEAVGDQLFLGSLSDTAWAVVGRPEGI